MSQLDLMPRMETALKSLLWMETAQRARVIR